MRCPGQDSGYWSGEMAFDVPCPNCGASVEIFRDEPSGRCPKCRHKFPNPKLAPDCARWCGFADQCQASMLTEPQTTDGTMNDSEKIHRIEIPTQNNLARATEMGLAAVTAQSNDQLVWLGAVRKDSLWQLPVLDDTLSLDPSTGRITTSMDKEVGPHWSILVLHYLAVDTQPEAREPANTFADLPAARSYSGIYQQRVITRLCATAGRDAEKLSAAAVSLGGRPVDAGDLAFDFDIFPRLSLRLIWHAADEEFPPSATMLLPDNIESYFCSEDIVVLSERLVSRLSGAPF